MNGARQPMTGADLTVKIFNYAILIGLVVWGASSLLEIKDGTQETLRLLRRGDKIDCRMSEMRGTQPGDER
jgi:hypothetical protein